MVSEHLLRLSWFSIMIYLLESIIWGRFHLDLLGYIWYDLVLISFFSTTTIKVFHKNKLNLFFIYIIYYLLFGD